MHGAPMLVRSPPDNVPHRFTSVFIFGVTTIVFALFTSHPIALRLGRTWRRRADRRSNQEFAFCRSKPRTRCAVGWVPSIPCSSAPQTNWASLSRAPPPHSLAPPPPSSSEASAPLSWCCSGCDSFLSSQALTRCGTGAPNNFRSGKIVPHEPNLPCHFLGFFPTARV